ncbi:MAG: hypothetical protein OEM05_14910 [Myxococcales bacterium]|nr:hypothetical protein [Myxococcales bacterium]
MYRKVACCLALILLPAAALAEEPAKPTNAADEGDKVLSGMSIVGNDEAPKSLVIVPWKSSELGDTLAVSRALDDGRQPVDRDVFMRELTYYEIRAGQPGHPGSDTQ